MLGTLDIFPGGICICFGIGNLCIVNCQEQFQIVVVIDLSHHSGAGARLISELEMNPSFTEFEPLTVHHCD